MTFPLLSFHLLLLLYPFLLSFFFWGHGLLSIYLFFSLFFSPPFFFSFLLIRPFTCSVCCSRGYSHVLFTCWSGLVRSGRLPLYITCALRLRPPRSPLLFLHAMHFLFYEEIFKRQKGGEAGGKRIACGKIEQTSICYLHTSISRTCVRARGAAPVCV